jgi:hypothetical protein
LIVNAPVPLVAQLAGRAPLSTRFIEICVTFWFLGLAFAIILGFGQRYVHGTFGLVRRSARAVIAVLLCVVWSFARWVVWRVQHW